MGALGGTCSIVSTVIFSKAFPSLPSFPLAQGGGSSVVRNENENSRDFVV